MTRDLEHPFRLRKGPFSIHPFRHIPCRDQLRAAPIVVDNVAGDVDMDDLAGLQPVPPHPGFVAAFGGSREVGHKGGLVFIRMDIGDGH
nr:hypothetical protein [Marivita lacus]